MEYFLTIYLIAIIAMAKLNIYSHIMALYMPWLVIVLMSLFDISYIHGDPSQFAYMSVFVFIFTYYLGTRLTVVAMNSIDSDACVKYCESSFNLVIKQRYRQLLYIYLLFTVVNVLLAGYVPLVQLILTGNSNYTNFGITGIYGFYNAFANAFGLFSLYMYLKLRKKEYLVVYLLILFVFLLFVTRQNIISLLVESFVLYGFVVKRTSYLKAAAYILLAIVAFAIIGDLRTSNIAKVVEVKESFLWLPSFVFWVYSYFYISFVNLSNAIELGMYLDGSSVLSLVPNFIKNMYGVAIEHEYFLQKANFTVSTALQSMYSDFGFYALVIYGVVLGAVTQAYYRAAAIKREFKYVAVYSILFFCALFSFFVNFWFYLPIIFQIPLIYLMSRYVVKKYV